MVDTMHAIDRALEAARQPKQLARQRPGALPGGMLDVIKCAAGDEETLAKLSYDRSLSEQKVRDAARVYLQHIITHANGSDRLVLALPKDSDQHDTREHKRWLLKWLHPDRNPSSWEANLFHRVKEAADRLENGKGQEPAPAAPAPFQGKRVSRRNRPAIIAGKSSAPGRSVQRLRKRDIVRMLFLPFLLAVMVVAAASVVWLRFGPRGGI